jgi:hypothetical protein
MSNPKSLNKTNMQSIFQLSYLISHSLDFMSFLNKRIHPPKIYIKIVNEGMKDK